MSQPEQQKKREIEAMEGIIGFFDILGYGGYLKNDPDVRSKEALQVLLKIKQEVPGRIKKRVPEALVDELSWTIFQTPSYLQWRVPEPRTTNRRKIIRESAG